MEFNNSTTYTVKIMMFPIMLTTSIVMTNFVVIDVSFQYNAIMGRPWIYKLKSIHLLKKYLIFKKEVEPKNDLNLLQEMRERVHKRIKKVKL